MGVFLDSKNVSLKVTTKNKAIGERKSLRLRIIKYIEMEKQGMLVAASSGVDKRQRIYHRCGCMYARRIKADNRLEMSIDLAKKRHYKDGSCQWEFSQAI